MDGSNTKKLMVFVLVLTLFCSCMPNVFAEETKDEKPLTYKEAELEDFNLESPAIYTAKTTGNLVLYPERDKDTYRVCYRKGQTKIEVLYVGIEWCIARYKDNIGFLKREKLDNISPTEHAEHPYGIYPSAYIATTNCEANVRKSMSETDDSFVTLQKGTNISIWQFIDDWAVVIYMRQYGYIHRSQLNDVTQVITDPSTVEFGKVLVAASSSFYKMDDTVLNQGRIFNIGYAADRLCMTIMPGESFNYNQQIGPFTLKNGYQKAPVLKDGDVAEGAGGGVCQVSSTLYNVLLQMDGIKILQRRPHGPSGASYLPHGVDAASGTTNLNLRFKNNYYFPVEIVAHSNGDGTLFVAAYLIK